MEAKIQLVHKIVNELCAVCGEDMMEVNEILIDVVISNMEVVMKFKRFILPKIQNMTTAISAVKLDLESTKKELSIKDQELKSVRKCSKCPTLEKELSVMKRKQAVNESRIKSIAKILSRQTPVTEASQFVEDDEDSDQSSVTKAYNLVSQVLGVCNHHGTRPEVDERIVVPDKADKACKKSPSPQRKTKSLKQMPNVDVNDKYTNESNDVLECSLDGTDKENEVQYFSPKKGDEEPLHISPVLGKFKKTPHRSVVSSPDSVVQNLGPILHKVGNELDDEDLYCIPPSPEKVRSNRKLLITPSSRSPKKEKDYGKKSNEGAHSKIMVVSPKESRDKKRADFWQLKTSPFIDLNTSVSKKQSTKLKQAKLSLGCFPKKVDLCDIEEFNGGIRPSQTSTQMPDKKSCENETLKIETKKPKVGVSNLQNDDDIVMDSPNASYPSNKRKGRSYSSGRKLIYDTIKSNIVGSGGRCTSAQVRTSRISKKDKTSQEVKSLDDSFDYVKKPSTSPKFKYRDGPVRKKHERQKLPGWDCENCKKYFEAAGGENASEEEVRKAMNRCSRHRDKNPIRPKTPPGFWDADFPATEDLKELDATCVDILPVSKRHKTT